MRYQLLDCGVAARPLLLQEEPKSSVYSKSAGCMPKYTLGAAVWLQVAVLCNMGDWPNAEHLCRSMPKKCCLGDVPDLDATTGLGKGRC
jgi:hypothetical protein